MNVIFPSFSPSSPPPLPFSFLPPFLALLPCFLLAFCRSSWAAVLDPPFLKQRVQCQSKPGGAEVGTRRERLEPHTCPRRKSWEKPSADLAAQRQITRQGINVIFPHAEFITVHRQNRCRSS